MTFKPNFKNGGYSLQSVLTAAFLLLVPEQGLAVAVMANSSDGRAQVQGTALRLAQELLEVPAAVKAAADAD